MKLIIAEKPSLARNIVQAIDPKMTRKDGYFINSEYIVTYAFGHLFTLYDVEKYKDNQNPEEKTKWTLDGLPFFPEKFKFGLNRDEGVIKQFKIIRDLANSDKVDTIINAGDSDREGEIIVRIILEYALKENKDIKRLWMPDQTPKTIRDELSLMRSDSDYDNLANEGYARTYVDWCYGINLTRYASIKGKHLLRVGRVIAPIVKAIYDKEQSIINFEKKKYYVISSKEKTNNEVVELTSKNELATIEDANKLIEKYNSLDTLVKSINKEEKIIPPGKLFSLSTLQGELGKKYKMSPDKSLEVVQSLYEKGYVSYPRTPSQYLATNEKGKFKEIISNFQKYNVDIVFKDSKYIFDDSKIESHSALTPTYKIPNKTDLTEDEHKVYRVIANRFFAVFCKEPFKVDRSVMEISNGEEVFKLSGDVITNPGWTKFESRDTNDKVLPSLKVGDKINVLFKPVEKETKPPRRYSVDSFNKFLKNPFKDELKDMNNNDDLTSDDTEDIKAMFEGIELGTEATRSTIIENAIKSEYISLKDNTYYLEPMGKYYVESLSKLGVLLTKEKTAELGKALKKVYRNEITIDDAVDIAKLEISEVINRQLEDIDLGKPPYIAEVKKENQLCTCPKCGHIIQITDTGYVCNNSYCKLSLYNNNKLFEKLGKKLTKKIAKEIFTKGRTSMQGLTSKSGKEYDAILVASFKDRYVNFTFEFPKPEEANSQKKQP